MKCKNCGREEEYNEEYDFYHCKFTRGSPCICGHWHKSHDKKVGCLRCDCGKFKIRRLTQKTGNLK